MDDILEPLVPEGTVAEPPGPPGRRRYLPYAMLGVALAIAAGGYLAGHASAGTASGTQTVAADNAVNAYLAQASVPAASAASCVTPRRGIAGTLKAVNGTTLTIARAGGGTVSVTTSPSTIIRRTVLGKTTDIKDGQVVAVQGTSSAQNAIAAQQVALLPTGAGPRLRSPAGGGRLGGQAPKTGFAVGTVAKASNGTFTVDLPDGTSVAITTSSSTKVVSTVDAPLRDLVIGQPTVVLGNVNSDGSISATQVAQGTADLGFGFNKGFGFGSGPFGRFGGRRGGGGAPTGPGMSPPTPAAPASVS
jgi:hypothetical protein